MKMMTMILTCHQFIYEDDDDDAYLSYPQCVYTRLSTCLLRGVALKKQSRDVRACLRSYRVCAWTCVYAYVFYGIFDASAARGQATSIDIQSTLADVTHSNRMHPRP
jgi:hypothetical protein